jgi:Cu2+-exporting ATPase
MKYACLMKCEGTKTYDQPGKCPVCGMKLAPVEEVGKDVKSKSIKESNISPLPHHK